jgi:hypothetical protein
MGAPFMVPELLETPGDSAVKKYVVLGAALLLASTMAVEAKDAGHRKFIFGGWDSQPFCDGGTGYWNGNQYAWVHTNFNCDKEKYYGGPGIEGKVLNYGKVVNMYDLGTYVHGSNCSIQFPERFKIGGEWDEFCSDNGQTYTTGGGYLLAPTAPKGQTSTFSFMQKAMAAHRNRKSVTE